MDFSAIELRGLAYIAKEKLRIEAFNIHEIIYEESTTKMYINTIAKESTLRQKGKIAELSLGYQGGVNDLIKMGVE